MIDARSVVVMHELSRPSRLAEKTIESEVGLVFLPSGEILDTI